MLFVLSDYASQMNRGTSTRVALRLIANASLDNVSKKLILLEDEMCLAAGQVLSVAHASRDAGPVGLLGGSGGCTGVWKNDLHPIDGEEESMHSWSVSGRSGESCDTSPETYLFLDQRRPSW